MIDVRIQKNGDYYRLGWILPDGSRGSEGLGHRRDMTDREREQRRRHKELELSRFPEAAGAKGFTLAQWKTKTRKDCAKLAAASLDDIMATFARLIDHFGEDKLLVDIWPEHAADFVRGLTEEPSPLSLATARKHVRNCKRIFMRAFNERRSTGVVENPFAAEVGAVPAVDKDWANIDTKTLNLILAACPSDGWRAMFALARLAAMRSNEARRLTWSDVLMHDTPPRIINRRPSHLAENTTKHRQRMIPIQPALAPILADLWERAPEGATGPCDGLPTLPNRLSEEARQIIVKAGFDYAKPLHTLRKNCETEWMRENPVHIVAAWCGNSPSVAVRNYSRDELVDMEKVTGGASRIRSDHPSGVPNGAPKN